MCHPKGYGFCTVIGNYEGVLTYLLFQFQINKKEKYANLKWILRKICLLALFVDLNEME